MILWINGTFGAGKTSTAAELVRLLPRARVYDPEQVGYMLPHVLTEPVDDF
jgi:adenylylsulfate kinase-like enzyme